MYTYVWNYTLRFLLRAITAIKNTYLCPVLKFIKLLSIKRLVEQFQAFCHKIDYNSYETVRMEVYARKEKKKATSGYKKCIHSLFLVYTTFHNMF